MPTYNQELLNIVSPQTRQPGPSVLSPGFAWGLTGGTVKNVAKGLVTSALNLGQSLNPTSTPIPGATIPIPQTPWGRVYEALNTIGFGIPKTVQERWKKEEAAQGPATGVDENVIRGLEVGAKTVLMDILPGQEIVNVSSGTDAAGNPLTSEQLGEQVGMGLLKTLPAAKGIGTVMSKTLGPLGAKMGAVESLGAVDRQFMRDVITAGQLKGLINAAEETPAEFAKTVLASRGRPKETLRAKLGREYIEDTEAAERVADMLPEKAAEKTMLRSIYTSALGSETAASTFERLAKEGKPLTYTQQVAEIIKDSTKAGLNPNENLGQLVLQTAKKYNISVDDAAKDMTHVLYQSAGLAGETLAEASTSARLAVGKLMMDSLKGGEEGMAAIKKLQYMEKVGKTPAGSYSKAASWINSNIEGFRRAMMVGQLATAMRNMVAQGSVGVLQLAEDTITGIVETGVGAYKKLAKGESMKPISQYFNDLGGDFSALGSILTRAENRKYQELIDSMPHIRKQLYGTVSQDIGTSMIWDVIKNRGELGVFEALKKSGIAAPENVFEIAKQTINAVNYFQETNLRRIFFLARLEGNLKRIGIPHFTEILDIIKSDPKGVGLEVKTAIADALEHSLKQTFAYQPEAGIGKAILNAYRQIPFSTAIFPPFPRFLMNQYQWQLERAPSTWFNLFSPKFRDVLMQGADGGFASADAARALGRATNGLMMLNAAWVLENSELRGPKYYYLKSGNKATDSDEEQYIDIRPWQPFATYKFLANQIFNAKNNQPNTTNSNEYIDAMIGVRRLGELPVFAALDAARAINRDDPNSLVRALATPTGQFLSSFFTPLHTLRELGGGLADQLGTSTPVGSTLHTFTKNTKALRDVETQELTGPTRQIIAPSTLPIRYDPMTGKPYTQEHPFKRQLMGMAIKDLTKFESYLYEFPGISINDVIGNQGHPIANELVAKHFGEFLKRRVGSGDTIGDILYDRFKNSPGDQAKKKEDLKSVIQVIRDYAVEQAIKENPKAFSAKILGSIYSPEQAVEKNKQIRLFWQKYGEPVQ